MVRFFLPRHTAAKWFVFLQLLHVLARAGQLSGLCTRPQFPHDFVIVFDAFSVISRCFSGYHFCVFTTFTPCSPIVSCIWVNCCIIISQVIIYVKVLKRLISILNLVLFCSTLPVALLLDLSPSHSCCFGSRLALLVVDLSPSQSFMLYVAQHLELLCLFLTCLRFNFSSFVLVNTLSSSAHCRVVSTVTTFLALCWTPRLALLVVQLSLAAI